MADVRIDTNEIEVVSAKDNNQKMQDIAEVVDSSNPFVANGQSKVLKHNNQYYLTTNPNYNWYKEVAQGCFAYKDGSNEITEKISAKGYRPNIATMRLRKTYAKGVEGKYTINRDAENNRLYYGDEEGNFLEAIPNSADKFSFYVMVHGAGGNGGGCDCLNQKGAGGGGSGAWSVINISFPNDYNGIVCRINNVSDGSIVVNEGVLVDGTEATIETVTCGIDGKDQSGLFGALVAVLASIIIVVGGIATIGLGGPALLAAGLMVVGLVVADDIHSSTWEEYLKNLPAGSGGVMVHSKEYETGVERNGIKYRIVKCGVGASGGGSGTRGENSSATSITDSPEGISAFTKSYRGGYDGSDGGSIFGTYYGGGGGGASPYGDDSTGISGGNGGDGGFWDGDNGTSGSVGAGGGGGGSGSFGSTRGGTGGASIMEIRF